MADCSRCSYSLSASLRIAIRSLSIALALLLLSSFVIPQAYADSFSTPEGLRPRVDFWKDVFARYGKNHAIIHVRNYPQHVLKVLDFSAVAEKLSASALEKKRAKKVEQEIKQFEKALKRLTSNPAASGDYEELLRRGLPQSARTPAALKRLNKEKSPFRSQRGIKERYREALVRSGRYIRLMERIFVDEYGLPKELTRLPFIESSFVYEARSSAGAVGIWQFMKPTGKQFLKINWLVDERKDVLKSTRAAAKYLRQHYKRFQSWPLAVTSYNHGAAGVARKVKKLGTTSIVRIAENPPERLFGFASTNFYPEFLAAVEIFENYRKYFPGLTIEPTVKIATRNLERAVRARDVISQLGVDSKELKTLNPALAKSVWSGSQAIPKGYSLRVPARFETKLRGLRFRAAPVSTASSSAIYGGAVYKVRSGDSLWKIAKRYGVSVSKLKAMNGLKSDRVRVGQVLRVRQPTASSVYVVRAGDTLGGIARRHRLSISELKRLNGLTGSVIKIGQRLKVKGGGSSAGTASLGSSATTSYRVRSGDTLSGLAKRYGTSVASIKQLNGLRSSKLVIGQKLKIKGRASSGSSSGKSVRYTVRSGDSLWSISRKYGSSVGAIRKANNLRSSTLRAGQKLTIPR